MAAVDAGGTLLIPRKSSETRDAIAVAIVSSSPSYCRHRLRRSSITTAVDRLTGCFPTGHCCGTPHAAAVIIVVIVISPSSPRPRDSPPQGSKSRFFHSPPLDTVLIVLKNEVDSSEYTAARRRKRRRRWRKSYAICLRQLMHTPHPLSPSIVRRVL